MSKAAAKKQQKKVSSSSEAESDSSDDNKGDEELMIGDTGVNDFGGFDDKKMDAQNEEAARKRKEAKEGNIIRKSR